MLLQVVTSCLVESVISTRYQRPRLLNLSLITYQEAGVGGKGMTYEARHLSTQMHHERTTRTTHEIRVIWLASGLFGKT